MAIPRLVVSGTDVQITRLGFGCGRIFGAEELKSSARLIEAALGAGIRHFDTAPAYGNGQSEAVLGAVLSGVEDVTITTKVGVCRPSLAPSLRRLLYRRWAKPVLGRFPFLKAHLVNVLSDVTGAKSTQPRHRLGADEVMRELEFSLKQLRRNRVDLYLVHEPDNLKLTDELRDLFASLQKDGTIGGFGLAWGRPADTEVDFGTVLQGKYHANLSKNGPPGATRIVHGVLRNVLKGGDRAGMESCVRETLDTYKDIAVIFSASTPSQVRDIASQYSK